jgi:hypothetical protein
MTKNKNIIALFGVEGSGKDTIGYMLRDLYNSNWKPTTLLGTLPKHVSVILSYPKKEGYVVTSFAEPIQRAVAAMLDVPLDKIQGHGFKDEPLDYITYAVGDNIFSDKEEALTLKEEFIRKGYCVECEELTTTPRDIIIHIAETMKEFMGDGIWAKIAIEKAKVNGKVIFTDLRFKSELKELKKRNALIVKVVCTDENGDETKGDLYQMHNFPEEEIDYIIYNKKGDWSHLKREVLRMIETLKL